MSYNVSVEVFEGPLDLLLNLIDKNEIDIYDIPINTVTEQFIDQLKKWEDMNLEVASDFIIMASTLLEIKSKLLLPNETVIVDGEEVQVDPREELVKRLMEYKLYKEISENLKASEEVYSKVYYKPQEGVSDFRDPFQELSAVELKDLVETLENILQRHRYNNPQGNFFEIRREEVSLEECTRDIESKVNARDSIRFSDIISTQASRSRIIAYFLSLLELMRTRFISVRQDGSFSDLIIEKRGI
ncbi:segregation and condensation protein A [Gudongella sp. SC589]|uniref:segregation and condensation protein A n=1 Tax=Gudongella sp. SC589 TaxID=3385990 RepID=UPI0039046586